MTVDSKYILEGSARSVRGGVRSMALYYTKFYSLMSSRSYYGPTYSIVDSLAWLL